MKRKEGQDQPAIVSEGLCSRSGGLMIVGCRMSKQAHRSLLRELRSGREEVKEVSRDVGGLSSDDTPINKSGRL